MTQQVAIRTDSEMAFVPCIFPCCEGRASNVVKVWRAWAGPYDRYVCSTCRQTWLKDRQGQRLSLVEAMEQFPESFRGWKRDRGLHVLVHDPASGLAFDWQARR